MKGGRSGEAAVNELCRSELSSRNLIICFFSFGAASLVLQVALRTHCWQTAVTCTKSEG